MPPESKKERLERWERVLERLQTEMEEVNGEGEVGKHEDKLETLTRFAREEATTRRQEATNHDH